MHGVQSILFFFTVLIEKKNAKQNKTKNQKQKRLKLLHNNSSGTE